MTTTGPTTGSEAADHADAFGWAVPGVGVTGGPRRDDSAMPRQRSGDHDTIEDSGPPAGADPGDLDGSGHPVVVAVLRCLEALESIKGAATSTLTAKEIRVLLLAVTQIAAVTFALKLRLLVAGEAQRVMDLTGARSMPTFLAHLTQMRREDASAEFRLARDLDRRFGVLAQALEAGLVARDQLAVCVAALRRLPRDLPADQLEAAQRCLVDACATMDPRQLKALGRRLWEVIDPDGADAKLGKDLQDEEELARAKAYFRSWRNGDGTTGFRGKLPDVQADMLIKAIQAFTSPRRRKNPNIPTSQPDDVRHPGATRDDVRHPDGQPDETPRGACSGDGSADDPHRGRPGGCCGDGTPFDEDGGETPEERDRGGEVPYPVRLGHGLMDLVSRLPEGLLPSNGGITAKIVVTTTLDQLRSGLGAATLDTGTEISGGQLRRLACQAGVIPMVLGGASQPLDVGREQRLHTKPQRVAIAARDGCCVIEGCDMPAAFSEFHHLTAWEEGGGTSVEDGIMVCPYHHHRIHDPKWQLQVIGDHRYRLRRR